MGKTILQDESSQEGIESRRENEEIGLESKSKYSKKKEIYKVTFTIRKSSIILTFASLTKLTFLKFLQTFNLVGLESPIPK